MEPVPHDRRIATWPPIRRALRRLVPVCLLSALTAAAGPNARGVLVVHEAGPWNSQVYDYRGPGTIPATCEEVGARIDVTPQLRVWKVHAAFAPGSGPRLKGITFGIDCSPGPGGEIVPQSCGPCVEFQLPDQGWPQPGTGNGLVWTETRTDLLVEVHWFVGYLHDSEPALFETIPHPTGGGWFGDDGVPSILDPIRAHGALGFFVDGDVPCPASAGACCLPDGSCLLLDEPDCAAEGGVFAGIGVPCVPDPCGPIPVDEVNRGWIKARYRSRTSRRPHPAP